MKQTHTKQVEEVMNGCGKKSCGYRNVRTRIPINYWQGVEMLNKVMSTQVERKLILCSTCKSILKGMQTAIQNELDKLEEHVEIIENKLSYLIKYRDLNTDDEAFGSEISAIITDCKNALAKIKEVLE